MTQTLTGITSVIKSDHMVNLIQELDGKLPDDRDKMLAALQWYLDLPDSDQLLFRVGRRTGIMNSVEDFYDSDLLETVNRICDQYDILPDNIDDIIRKLMNKFR